MRHPPGRYPGCFRIAAMAACIPVLSSCIGIPIKRQSVSHILATGWTRQGVPVALAQRVVLGKTAYAASPEGAGIFERYRLGPLLLLQDDSKTRIKIPDGPSEVEVVSAEFMPTEDGFLVLADVTVGSSRNGSDRRCFKVGMDGEVKPCRSPGGYRFDAFTYYIEPWDSMIWFRRPAEAGSGFEVLDFATGDVAPLDDEFLTLRLRFPNDLHAPRAPCEMDNAVLSPGRDAWAVACSISHDGDAREGLWLIRRNTAPRLLLEFKTAEIAVPKGPVPAAGKDLEDLVTWPREESSLIWSPDQKRLYWCGGRGSAGVVVSLDGGPVIRHSPCLKLGAWSPDGKSIAGVEGRKLRVWRIAGEPAF